MTENTMKCHQCYYRVPNVAGEYCCAFYIHRHLKKRNHTGPPVGGAWAMCQGKHFQQRAATTDRSAGA